jgi:hypothetical protein
MRALKEILTDRGSFATTLLVVFLDEYTTEGLEWDPATIQMELEHDNGIDLPAENFDRLMTAIHILTDDNFFNRTSDFVRDCVTLSGHHVDEASLILPDSSDLAWGITEALLISPPEDDNEEPFSAEICGLIGEVLDQEGILTPPDVLKIGARSKNSYQQVVGEYADDPEMFSAINKTEQGKSDDISQVLRERMHGLLQQLSEVPLKNGDAAGVVAKLRHHVPAAEPRSLAADESASLL